MSCHLLCSRKESERRVELVMGKGEVVDALQKLGCLLQEEMHLSEQLNCGATQDRYCGALYAFGNEA